MTVQDRLRKYNEEAIDTLFEPQERKEKFEGFISIIDNTIQNKMENKNSQYLKLIRTQEQIIKELKETNWMYFLGGFTVGILVAYLIIVLTTIIVK